MATATEPQATGSGTIEKGAGLSEQVLQQVKESQQSAIEAVRGFMESVDEALPDHGDTPSKRQEIIDSALQMSQKLVKTEYDFLTSVVHSAGEAVTGARKQP
jgi:hypothetical protein